MACTAAWPDVLYIQVPTVGTVTAVNNSVSLSNETATVAERVWQPPECHTAVPWHNGSLTLHQLVACMQIVYTH